MTSTPILATSMMISHVRRIAGSFKRTRPNCVEFDDLVGDGCIGLVKAIRDFDPLAGASFQSYAGRRITGEILDGMRRMSHFSRWHHEHQRTEAAFISLDEFPAIGSMLQSGDNLHQEAERNELVRLLMSGIERLPLRWQIVLRRYYWEDHTMKEIGNELGVDESRPMQLRNKAVLRLRAELAQ